jgi:adenosylcobyric acid synthase
MTTSSSQAKCLMIQGTGSGVGKSILTAAFCRKFYKDGWKTAPFKAQNMSLNSFITEDGGEIGRAQAYQAEACGIAPTVAMNPVLMKPSGDNKSQIIVMGKAVDTFNAKEYYKNRPRFYDEVIASLNSLRNQNEIVVLEGAGSPAEINLRDHDFVNMPMAEAADAPVIIVGDIDKGGVFAWMKGTYDLLTPDEKERISGFIINKFRGDVDLLTPGIKLFEDMVGKPVLGTIPFYRDLFVDEEDAIPTSISTNSEYGNNILDVAIIRLPRISNFTDFSPLDIDPSVSVRYVWRKDQIGNPDLLIIPGTKNTIDDLIYLKTQGIDAEIARCHKSGTIILGICGGLQMLGESITDLHGLESKTKEIAGLGLLNMETTLEPNKITRQVMHQTVSSAFESGLTVKGYEIHMGRTKFFDNYSQIFSDSTSLGAGLITNDGKIIATYLHGFLDHDDFRLSFLNHIRKSRGMDTNKSTVNYSEIKLNQLDKLSQIIDDHMDISNIYKIMNLEMALP